MRVFICATLLAAASVPAAQAAMWTAACTGQNQIQYVQTVNGDGYLHLGQGNGTFTSIKLKQSYHDDKMICGSTATKAAPNEVGAICADNDKQVIRIEYGSQLAKGLRPEKAPVYCQAVVNISE
jgi:hypothetical protein